MEVIEIYTTVSVFVKKKLREESRTIFSVIIFIIGPYLPKFVLQCG